MNRRILILLQVLVWSMLLLWPFTFVNHDEGISLVQLLLLTISPLTTMTVFYLNSFWLTPKYFMNGEKQVFWGINIALCTVLGILGHFTTEDAMAMFDDNARIEEDFIHELLFLLRDIFTLLVFAGIAITLRLSLRFYKSEEERHKAEVAKADAELRILRNQISPHFLLNTLNNIYALTAFDTAKAQEAIQELSKMLRHMLYENQEETVDWDDEVQFLRSYVNLMKIRLPQNVRVDFKASNHATKPVRIAPLLFISLIENAFKHGVSTVKDSFVTVMLTANDDHVICDICNSNYPKPATDQSGNGIGLMQVQRRLDLAYPDCYTWDRGVSDDGRQYHSVITIFAP